MPWFDSSIAFNQFKVDTMWKMVLKNQKLMLKFQQE